MANFTIHEEYYANFNICYMQQRPIAVAQDLPDYPQNKEQYSGRVAKKGKTVSEEINIEKVTRGKSFGQEIYKKSSFSKHKTCVFSLHLKRFVVCFK